MKTFKFKHVLFALLIGMFAFSNQANAQVIMDSQNRVDIQLESGDNIVLYGKAKTRDQSFSTEYYYLPANLGLSKKSNGIPEFLFAKYTTEEKADAGGVQGAILHALFKWGLTPEQQKEAEKNLRAQLTKLKASGNPLYKEISPENATINGAASLKSGGSKFRVISATLQEEEQIVSSSAPVLPGSKVAIAAKMDKNEAQLLASTFEKGRSITDLSISIDYEYDVLFPAVDGEIVFNWSALDFSSDTYDIDHGVKYKMIREKYKKKFLGITYATGIRTKRVEDGISHTETSELFQLMQDMKVVEINIDQNVSDEVSTQITNQFMGLFMQAIADANSSSANDKSEEPKEPKSPSTDVYAKEKEWTFNANKITQKIKVRREVYNLRLRVPITMPGNVTANLADFYDQVRDNKSCVYSVNLNDPFFQHRDILMVLDLDAADIFQDEVNYVTVDVRKRRSSGNDFQDQVTIDKKYVDENGVRAALTYARGEDKNPDLYEYKTQWSLRGGNIYPSNARWLRGEWEGITLEVPITPRKIEFEADLEQLKKLGIPRATLQVRYEKFGKEYEKNLHISVAKGEALVSSRIFTDKDVPGYMYRLILNHKEMGKMALDWQAKTINDDYVYATVPAKLEQNDKEFLNKILNAAKDLNAETNSDGSVKKGKGVLGKILDFLGKVTE